MGTGSVAPVHTACGRSESKRLRPTLAGHAEGCPVIALCLGHSEGPGTAPSAVTQVPAALPRSTARGLRHGDTPPSPLGAPLFPSATLKPLPHLCQGPSGREPGVLCPCCPQPFIGGWGRSGGSLRATRPSTGSQVGGGVRSRLQRRFSRRGKQRGPWPRSQQCPTRDPALTPQDARGSRA